MVKSKHDFLQEADLMHLREFDFGDTVLRLDASRDWPSLLQNRPAMDRMARYCVLCGVHVARAQSFHAHLRTQHHEYVEHVLLKAAQLQKAFGGGAPCQACGTSYKRRHACIVWTQLSLLCLRLPPKVSGTMGAKKTLILKCEVCQIKFSDVRRLQHHIHQRGLVIQDWVVVFQFLECCDGWSARLEPRGLPSVDGLLPRDGASFVGERPAGHDGSPVSAETPPRGASLNRPKRSHSSAGCQEGIDIDGAVVASQRDGSCLHEDTRHLHPAPGSGLQGLGSIDHAIQCSEETQSVGDPSTSHSLGEGDLSGAVRPLFQGGCGGQGGTAEQEADQGSHLDGGPQSDVGWVQLSASPNIAQREHVSHAQDSGGRDRTSDRTNFGGSLHIDADQRQQQDCDVAIAGPDPEWRPCSATLQTLLQCSVESSGSAVQAAQTPAQCAGQPVGPDVEPPIDKRDGEGQKGETRAGIHTDPGQDPEELRGGLQRILTNLVLGNNSTWCYANSAVFVTLWTCGCISNFDVAQLRVGGQPILATIDELQTELSIVYLINCKWFHIMMRGWVGGSGRADASELVHFMLETITPQGFDHCWEKRVRVTKNGREAIERMDSGTHYAPMVIQFRDDVVDAQTFTLQALVTSWCKDWNMTTALLRPSSAIFLQIDRFRVKHGQIEKIRAAVTDCARCVLPIFSACSHEGPHVLGCNCWGMDYRLVGAVVHNGTPSGGHYQCLLRDGPPNPDGSGKWLLADDNCGMVELPDWSHLESSIVLLSFVRDDALRPLTVHSRIASSDPYQMVDETDLLTMLTQ